VWLTSGGERWGVSIGGKAPLALKESCLTVVTVAVVNSPSMEVGGSGITTSIAAETASATAATTPAATMIVSSGVGEAVEEECTICLMADLGDQDEDEEGSARVVDRDNDGHIGGGGDGGSDVQSERDEALEGNLPRGAAGAKGGPCRTRMRLPIQSGCSCRGAAGFAHVSCLIEACGHLQDTKGDSVWRLCGTCKQGCVVPMKPLGHF
jgi:hypothetical protein